jgi:Fur family ferric uptake transcriptional regulator
MELHLSCCRGEAAAGAVRAGEDVAMRERSRPEQESLRADLRARGLRATPSRLAVLRLLRGAERPVSHADVVDALAAEPWNRSTLYRNLTDLVAAGLAGKTELGDHVWRFYDATVHEAGDHPHFVCTACGAVLCLEDAQVSLRVGKNGPRALRESAVEVQVRGLCDRCR